MHRGASPWGSAQTGKKTKADPCGLTGNDHQVRAKRFLDLDVSILPFIKVTISILGQGKFKVSWDSTVGLKARKHSKTMESRQKDPAVCLEAHRDQIWDSLNTEKNDYDCNTLSTYTKNPTSLQQRTDAHTCTHPGKRKLFLIKEQPHDVEDRI